MHPDEAVAVGAALIHYGDVPSHRTGLRKDDRNTRLLRMCLEDDPADGEIAGYLVVQLIKDGDAEEARAVGERHFPPFLARNESRPEGHYAENMVRIGYSLGLLQTEAGDHAEALQTVRDALRFTPDQHPNLVYVEGLALSGLGDHQAAQRCFEKVLAVHGRHFAQPVLPSITDELSRLKITGLHMARGDFEAARRALPETNGPWDFARSLMAAEIVVTGAAGLGGVLELGREIGAIDVVMAVILVILVVGIATEQLVFARLERWVNRRWGLVGAR